MQLKVQWKHLGTKVIILKLNFSVWLMRNIFGTYGNAFGGRKCWHTCKEREEEKKKMSLGKIIVVEKLCCKSVNKWESLSS